LTYKFYKAEIPEVDTVDSFIRRHTDIAERIDSFGMNNIGILEQECNLPILGLQNAVHSAFTLHGWHGFLIANFGEGYGDKDLRSERLGGLSITYNPDYRQQDININCQTLGNKKYNLPPEMYAGKRGNGIFEQVNILDLRSEFFHIVNNQGAGPAWDFIYEKDIISKQVWEDEREYYHKWNYNPAAKNQTGKNTYSDALGFNRLTPACEEGYLGEVFGSIINNGRTIVRGRIIETMFGGLHWHRDESFYMNFRINIPLYFDDSTMIATKQQEMHMHPGYMYHFDTGLPHAVLRKHNRIRKRINIILGICPWFDFHEEDQSWVSNEYYGRMHPVDMFKEGLLVDFA
tara:strand:+ start:3405 stop:4442 length:1038 start_codon:yes stop_codon:yes gene_type:complete